MTLLRPPDPPTRPDRLRVLLADDRPTAPLREALLTGLAGAALRTCPASGVADALADRPCDAAVLDLAAAGALDTLAALRSGWPALPVVAVRADDDVLARRALDAGANELATGPDAVAGVVLRVVERARAAAASRRYESLARTLLDSIDAATCAVDGEGVITVVNAAWQRGTGDAGDSGPGASYRALCLSGDGPYGADGAAVARGLDDVLAGRRPRFEQVYRCGDEQWCSARLTPMVGGPGAVVSHVDVTAIKRAQDAAAHLALHDDLTGLPNRLLLEDRLEQALAEASRHGSVVAVAFVDLDHFKRVNDTLGHPVGDALLVAVADRLSRRLRAGDTLARVSGDEFVVVWRDVADDAEVGPLAQRLEEGLRAPLEVEGSPLTVTASVGVVVGRPPQTGLELLAAADTAMYDAKGRGRARLRLYGPELQERALQRSSTSQDLQAALDRDELVVHYQPVVDLATGHVVGVEALVRWEHPERGLLGPEAFLPVAEATGLVLPLGDLVLRQACAEAARWPDGPGLGLEVAVNLSVRQVTSPDLVRSVREALERSGLPASRLVLDVTESAVREDAGAARSGLHDLAALGARICVDDVGTGVSSLQQLVRYPVGALKVDRRFVAGLGRDADDEAIVASVLGLAHAVGARSVAEGVETAAQAAALRGRGYDLAQGHLFSPPVPAADLARALDDSRAAAAPLAGVAPPEAPLSAEVTERIRTLHASGASLHTIAAALNRSGAAHPAGLRWHARAVARALGTPLVDLGQGRVPPQRGSRGVVESTS